MSADPSITVNLGGGDVALVDPPSMFAMSAAGRSREDVERASAAEHIAYGAASLRMCWPGNVAWPCKPRPRPWAVGQDVMQYGAEVCEGLRKATKGTVHRGDLSRACDVALRHAVLSDMTMEELKAAEDFSASQEE